jgi:hypothetical protein
VESITVDLLAPDPCPEAFNRIEPLRLSLVALRDKFTAILASEGFSTNDLTAASATFSKDAAFEDDYGSICQAILVSKSGRSFEHKIGCLGRSASA